MASAFSEEDDVPPLEDLSDLFARRLTSGSSSGEEKQARNAFPSDKVMSYDDHKGGATSSQSQDVQRPGIDMKPSQTPTGSEKTAKSCDQKSVKSSSNTFGGLQKGFLNKKPKSCQAKVSQQNKKDCDNGLQKVEEMPVIRPKTTVADELKLPEVQEAMKTPNSLLQNTDWVTDDLLKKLERRPDLLRKLSDPRYSQALNQFSRNPQAGWQHLSGDADLQGFVRELCGVLGDHFSSMTGQQNGAAQLADQGAGDMTKADHEQMTKILSDPEIVNILKDPWICKLVKNLKENPTEARRMLASSRPDMLPKIRKLVDAGILTFS